jgi:hypothetical protein
VVDERTLAIGKWYARGHGDKAGKARKGRAEDRRQKTEDRRQKTEKMLEVNLQPCRAYGPEGGLRQEIGQSQ